MSWPRRLALLLPSLWLLLAIAVPPGEDTPWSRALFYLAIVLTLAGIPFLAALLLRVTIVGYEQIPSRRRLVAAAVVGLVVIAAFGLGQFNNRYLTCNDFIVSGNDPPPGCTQGQATWDGTADLPETMWVQLQQLALALIQALLGQPSCSSHSLKMCTRDGRD